MAHAFPEVPAQVFIEVPDEEDCLELARSGATELNWLPRDLLDAGVGEAMVHAARELARLPRPDRHTRKRNALEEIDIERQILWERGLDRKALPLMGYWRTGRSFD